MDCTMVMLSDEPREITIFKLHILVRFVQSEEPSYLYNLHPHNSPPLPPADYNLCV
jgi:hypothetical protein